MDRVVLRAPAAVHDGSYVKQTTALLVVTAALLVGTLPTTLSLSSLSSIDFLLSCSPSITILSTTSAFCISAFILKKRETRRFIEAVVEITPIGVQLVSVYGTCINEASPKSRRHKVRSFIPTQQILDVVVMEVVWPHCVWSQVVFRVVNGTEGLPSGKEVHVQELMKKNRVSIVPAFPEECQGVLSYKQCLQVQSEIEGLLGMQSDNSSD